MSDGFAKHEPILRAGLTRLNLPATDNQVAQLLSYGDLLLRWNKVYNLTAIRNSTDALSHHLLDCLAVVTPLRVRFTQAAVLDVGSGGGLPGIVLSIMNPTWAVTCVDAVAKKMAFVSQAAGTLRLTNLSATHTRLVPNASAKGLSVGGLSSGYDLVTSRAFASLADMVALTRFHVKHVEHARWVAMKGKLPDVELAALPGYATHEETQQLLIPGLDEDRCLVWLRPVAPTVQ